jgi:hypothetical protein
MRRTTAITFAAVLAVVAAGAAANAKDFSDGGFCQAMTQKGQALKANRAQWIDDETRLDAINADCEGRTLEFRYYLKQKPSEMRHGWEDEMQRRWDANYCSDADTAEALAHGWTVKVTLTLADDSTLPLDVYCRH